MKKMFIRTLLSAAILQCAAAEETLLAEWNFTKGIHSADGKIQCAARGKTKVIDGALETGEVPKEQPEGIQTAQAYPELTPSGAFRIVVEFELKKPTSVQPYLFFWDSKCDFYDKKNENPKDNSGFTFGLYRNPKSGELRPQAWFGFGKATAVLNGKSVAMEPGRKYTLELDYDGIGTAKFLLDGKINAEVKVVPGGPLAPAQFRPVIGDRALGHFFRFDGRILSLKIFVRPSAAIQAGSVGRTAFFRNEKNASLRLAVRNLSNEPMTGLKMTSPVGMDWGELAAGESKVREVPLETRLKQGKYELKLQFTGTRNGKAFSEKSSVPYAIGPVRTDSMTVMMWGYSDSFKVLQNTGFTHGLKSLVSPMYAHPKDDASVRAQYADLDDMLCEGFWRADYFNISHYPSIAKKFPRLDREGKPIAVSGKMNIDANDPAAIRFLGDMADLVSKTYGAHPALELLDVNSEIRDRTAPSFSRYERDAFKAYSGFDVPAGIKQKTTQYALFPDFPFSRVISDKDPILVYYRWFWKEGDGWNPLNGKISEIYHNNIPHEFRSYFAPSTRQPPIWGPAGKVDVISQWTYAYPDPLRMASATDEILAMAEGNPGTPIMEGTQLICYRSQTAPIGKKVPNEPAWVKEHPDAKYITIPPDSLREAFWSKISRKVDGIVYHGDGSIYLDPVKKTPTYINTNPKTEPVLQDLLKNIVKPLGPTLKRIPERSRDVAILHSFASSMFAGRGSYGWGGWIMDIHLALQWGGLDPRVIYEEEILRYHLKGVKVLVMPHCDVLPESVYKAVCEFQRRGGILIADEFHVPGLLPDIRIDSVTRVSEDAAGSKAQLQKLGKEIRSKLGEYYTSHAASDNPDLVTHTRTFKNADYLFVINDKRVYGDYFGPWKLTQEQGVPNAGTITVNRETGAVYDLVKHQGVDFRPDKGMTRIPVHFDTNDGLLLLLLPKPIAAVSVSAPAEAANGGTIPLNVTVTDTSSRPVEALIPIELEVTDAAGTKTDDSFFACAENGKYSGTITIPLNAEPGSWKIRARELASGKSANSSVMVAR